jgi:hypothetical protein
MPRAKRRPGRPPKAEKDKVGVMLALRLSEDDKRCLDALVQKRAARLAAEGGAVSASSVIRALIRQAAEAEGLAHSAEPAPRRKPSP